MGRIIIISPAGEVSASFLEGIREAVEERLLCITLCGERVALPSEAYSPERAQYLAPSILGSAMSPDSYNLLLTHVDLYCPDLNFVFGYAMPSHRIAIVSTARFRDRVFERTLKTAIHEMGHLFGLPHCHDKRCVMHFSFDVVDTDYKKAEFCYDCKKILEESCL